MATKKEIIEALNHALELEHAANVQYLSHAEIANGVNADPIIERLKEIAVDEQKHAEMFRTQIGALGGVPAMGIDKTHNATSIKEILEVNLKGEMEAVDTYRKIMQLIKECKELQYEDFRLEHEVRHVIIDEMEHIEELRILLGLL